MGTAYCKTCASDALFWLRTLSGSCADDGLHCDSRFIMAPCAQSEDRSSCKCPSKYPHFVETSDGSSGCIAVKDCHALGETLDCMPLEFVEYPRAVSSQCEYEYTLCYADNQCDGELVCNIPEDSYVTCVPLF
eukprot:1004165_1